MATIAKHEESPPVLLKKSSLSVSGNEGAVERNCASEAVSAKLFPSQSLASDGKIKTTLNAGNSPSSSTAVEGSVLSSISLSVVTLSNSGTAEPITISETHSGPPGKSLLDSVSEETSLNKSRISSTNSAADKAHDIKTSSNSFAEVGTKLQDSSSPSVIPARPMPQTTKPVPVVVIEEQRANATKSQTVIQLPTDSQTTAGSKEILKCEECEYSTVNKHYLKQHVDLVHSDVRPYKCPFCDYAGKRSHSLKEHLVVHSSDRPYECHLCNATFRKKGHLTNHIKMHSPSSTVQLLGESGLLGSQDDQPGNIFICGQCEFASTSKSVFLKHLATCSKTPVTENEQSCESPWVSMKESGNAVVKSPPLGIPSSITSSPVVLMKCTECGFTSGDKELLKKHMWIHITQPLAASNSAQNASTSTPAIADTVSKLQNRQAQDQAASTSFKCGECLHETKEAYKFIAHMLTHKSSTKTDKAALITSSTILPTQSEPERSLSVPNTKPKATASQKVPESSGFTHDKSVGRFCCNICGYTCDHQRTIKAHVWRHSGHKDIDYPMFQNGPMSIYDEVGSEDSGKTNNQNTPLKTSVCTSATENQSGAKTSFTSLVSEALAPNSQPQVDISKSIVKSVINNVGEATQAVVSSLSGSLIQFKKTDTLPKSQDAAPNKANMDKKSVAAPARTEVQNVQLNDGTLRILLPDGFKSVTGQIQAIPKTNPPKRPISEIHINPEFPDGDNTVLQGAKRLCAEEYRSSPNVVVEKVNAISQLSTCTGLRSLQSSPRGPDFYASVDGQSQMEVTCPLDLEGGNTESQNSRQTKLSGDLAVSSNINSDNVVILAVSEAPSVSSSGNGRLLTQAEISKLIASGQFVKTLHLSQDELSIAMEVEEKDSEQSKDSEDQEKTVSVHDESALTLLSLLQRGVQTSCMESNSEATDNDNTQLSEYIVEVCEEQVVSTGEGSQTTEDNGKDGSSSTELDDCSETNKPKAGICSSLLAVIEQLRERSKSESETDETSQINMFGKRKPRRRNQRNSRDTPFQVESMENVEKLEDFETKYRCKLCHYTNSSPPLIKQHMRLHKTKKPFECSLCDFVADSSESLQDHMIQHCKMRTYQCKLCPSAFNYKSQLRAHMRAHSEKDPFLCDICDFETTNPITFRNHTRFHTDKNLLRCEDCGSFFSDNNELSTHRRSGCKSNRHLLCEECVFEASCEEELKDHSKIHKSRDLQCPQCEIVFSSQSSLRLHLRTHEETKEMKCELCNFLAASSRSLKSHMKRHINDQRYVQQPLEQYKCNLCGYVCHHLPSLKSHMWRHASDKNYIYEFTNEVINAAIDYDSRHDNTVTDAKPANIESKEDSFEIVEEDLSAPDSQGDRAPTNKKVPCLITFRCCQCGFETISKSDLNQHMKMHSDIIQKTLEVSKTLSQSGLTAKRVHIETLFESSPNSQPEDSCLTA